MFLINLIILKHVSILNIWPVWTVWIWISKKQQYEEYSGLYLPDSFFSSCCLSMHVKLEKHPSLINIALWSKPENYLQDWDKPFDPQSLVRVGIPPLEMLDVWTWCTWYLQDFQNREFTFFDKAGTVSGRSILNHTAPETEGSFRNQTNF